MRDRIEAGPVVVVSPHFDDGVFGCGQLLAGRPGSTVVTVLAGRPPAYPEPSRWDTAAGFGPGEDVVAARRAEDQSALGLLDAHPVWLDFIESQYTPAPIFDDLCAALEKAILAVSPATVLVPLGLFHSDHKLIYAAALWVRRRHPALTWLAYEEPNYRRVPNLLEERLQALWDEGILARPMGSSGDAGRAEKRGAVEEYRSQLRAFAAPGYPGIADVFEAEWYWALSQSGPSLVVPRSGAGQGDG